MNRTNHRTTADWIERSSGCCVTYYHQQTGRILKGSLPADSGTVYTSPEFMEHAPLRAYFDYTNLCNLECAHCITSSSPHADTSIELSTDRVLEVIRELISLGVFEIQVSGGEPLVHPKWREILSCITVNGANLILTTNGTRLNDKTVADLVAIRPLEVRVSFDGGPRLHDQIRGEGAYRRAMAGAERLVKAGINTTARYTLVQGGEDEIANLCADLKGIGINRLKVALIKNAGRAASDGRSYLRDMPTRLVTDFLLALGAEFGMEVQLSMDDFTVDAEESHDPKLRSKERKNCGAGFETVYISPQGNVLGCVTIPGMGFGNLKARSFREIWEGRVAAEFRHRADASGARRICDALNAPVGEGTRIGLALIGG